MGQITQDIPDILETPTSAQVLEVSVVLPCLNEHETLEACIAKATAALNSAGIEGEVVVADNGSTDGSIEIAESAGARLVHIENRGYGNALKGGIQAAHGTFMS